MREVVIDSEWSGFDHNKDYIIEVCCLEIVDRQLSQKKFHSYVKPPVSLSNEVSENTGIGNKFLSDKPPFAEIVDPLLAFIGDGRLISHGISLELDFLNAELKRLAKPPFLVSDMFDTVTFLREKFPDLPASLDPVSERYELTMPSDQDPGPGYCESDAWLTAQLYLKLCEDFGL
jgi:DNA polymerase III subunit epsilon